jgi:hypothetical protein
VSQRTVLLAWLAFGLAACSSKLSLDACQKDADCASEYNVVVSANQTVSSVCPRGRPNETNPACDSAMATLDAAEASLFPRLKSEDALSFSANLMATR